MEKADKLRILQESVVDHPDFPKPGILFHDIFGILKNVTAFRALRDLMVEYAAMLDVEVIVGLDSRGFLLGPIISLELSKPFVAIRKKGKLPGKVIAQSYELEYGEDTFEIQVDAIKGKKKALIVDDLLATGGTMSAAEKLLTSSGVYVQGCLVVIELKSLNGRSKLNAPLHSLLKYNI
ncbi:hypothetical protein QAD02_015634 [Eretmocerus hayati]|uniref:Uncharacterized protein n=1 Tax=Eretmocerus hayati TaxID=131215 RepID=A0ACC2P8T2_9HYME|nr:hypothetical protein QAD02_015634 [Eretmocerus hayati]